MNHYTYRLIYQDGRQYIGVRSCECEPHEDIKYLGSSKHTKNLVLERKEILGIFSTRQDAVADEIALHEIYDVARSDLFVNKAKQTSTKFDTSGVRLVRSANHNMKIKEALIGRKRSPEECAAISAGKVGRPRKPHSEEAIRKMSESRKGTPGYKCGERFDPEHHIQAYASRTKYSDVYHWQHESGEEVTATCMEMGHRYGSGAKPTTGFSRVVSGVKPSRLGWKLKTQTN